MSDEEVHYQLDIHGEYGFESMPQWLQDEVTNRNLLIPRRKPTNEEKHMTFKDERQHRILNKELTIKDYVDKYKHRRSLTLIT